MRQVKSAGLNGTLFRRRMFVQGWAALVGMSSLLLVACGSGSKEAAEAPPPGVLVAQVAMRQISETVEYVGQTVAVNDVSLRRIGRITHDSVQSCKYISPNKVERSTS